MPESTNPNLISGTDISLSAGDKPKPHLAIVKPTDFDDLVSSFVDPINKMIYALERGGLSSHGEYFPAKRVVVSHLNTFRSRDEYLNDLARRGADYDALKLYFSSGVAAIVREVIKIDNPDTELLESARAQLEALPRVV